MYIHKYITIMTPKEEKIPKFITKISCHYLTLASLVMYYKKAKKLSLTK